MSKVAVALTILAVIDIKSDCLWLAIISTQDNSYSTLTRSEDNMSNKIIPSLVTLPVELVYRILDHLEPFDILLSARNVCTRLNAITETYHRYQVNFIILVFSKAVIISKELLFLNDEFSWIFLWTKATDTFTFRRMIPVCLISWVFSIYQYIYDSMTRISISINGFSKNQMTTENWTKIDTKVFLWINSISVDICKNVGEFSCYLIKIN